METVPASWQRELADAVTCPRELLSLLGLPASLAEAARRAGAAFSLRVTRSFIARMRPGDANDPLLRQVLPVSEELAEVVVGEPDLGIVAIARFLAEVRGFDVPLVLVVRIHVVRPGEELT